MYAHCIYCKGHLGSNQVVEQFTVGGRLAFDERQGRLWVVCPRCGRWNLSPVEERWEVIETCERLYRLATRRVSTDHIGLAIHPRGLDLVRVGEPQRPEMAAWRYGRALLERRRRHRQSQVVTVGAYMAGTPFIIPLLLWRAYRRRQPVAYAEAPSGAEVGLTPRDARTMRILRSGGDWVLEVGSTYRPQVTLRGEEALRVAGHLLPWINRKGSGEEDVEHAVQRIEAAGTGQAFFRAAAPKLQERVGALVDGGGLVRRAHPTLRLALEMAAHEETELRAMRGELQQLEAAWREAEEIGGIADSLLLPEPVRAGLERLRDTVLWTGP